MFSLWNLSNCKSPQVSKTLLSNLADLNNAVVWMVSTCLLISNFFSPCTNPILILTRAPITIGNTVILMFHSFPVPCQGRGTYLSFRFLSILLWESKVHNYTSSFLLLLLLLIITRSGHLAEIRWSVCMSKSQRSLCISFSTTDSGLCIYHLFV